MSQSLPCGLLGVSHTPAVFGGLSGEALTHVTVTQHKLQLALGANPYFGGLSHGKHYLVLQWGLYLGSHRSLLAAPGCLQREQKRIPASPRREPQTCRASGAALPNQGRIPCPARAGGRRAPSPGLSPAVRQQHQH